MTELIDDGRLEMARREIQHDKHESKHLIKLNSVARVETDFWNDFWNFFLYR